MQTALAAATQHASRLEEERDELQDRIAGLLRQQEAFDNASAQPAGDGAVTSPASSSAGRGGSAQPSSSVAAHSAAATANQAPAAAWGSSRGGVEARDSASGTSDAPGAAGTPAAGASTAGAADAADAELSSFVASLGLRPAHALRASTANGSNPNMRTLFDGAGGAGGGSAASGAGSAALSGSTGAAALSGAAAAAAAEAAVQAAQRLHAAEVAAQEAAARVAALEAALSETQNKVRRGASEGCIDASTLTLLP